MDQGRLFDRGRPEEAKPAGPLPPRIGPKRMRHAVRNQVEIQECSLDELLPDEHEARTVWVYVCGLDLSELQQRIQSVEGGPGQAPAEPRILLALWLYATLRGVGSARELNRLCQQHMAYRWSKRSRVGGTIVTRASVCSSCSNDRNNGRLEAWDNELANSAITHAVVIEVTMKSDVQRRAAT